MIKKINLLLIATGKYTQFVTPLIDSVEKFFFINDEVKIFLFTDSTSIDSRAIFIEHKHSPWPLPTLKRFDTFSKNAMFFKDKDSYTFYLDVDSLVVGEVDKEILPENDEIVVVAHPGFWDKIGSGSWETRKESMAYTPPQNRVKYFAGGFFGAKTIPFIEMIQECAEMVEKDLGRGIVPVHNDESIMQAYLINKSKKVLEPSYVYPEGGQEVHKWFTFNGSPKILALNKNHEEIRN